MLFDRVAFSTATVGAGTITAGAADAGFRDLATGNGGAAIPDGTLVEYAIEDGTDFETGVGITGGGATTMTRVVSQSTNGGAALVLSGSAKVYLTPISSRFNRLCPPWWIYQVANYALANSTAEQKLFNQTANGRLALPTGVFQFNTFFSLSGMSATSGSAAFDPVGAGTAVCDQFAYDSVGLDNNTQPNAVLAVSGVGSFTQQSGANVVLAGTGTGMRARIQGRFRVTTAGTIIPSVALVTASAASVLGGSHFMIEKIGESSENFYGDWD